MAAFSRFSRPNITHKLESSLCHFQTNVGNPFFFVQKYWIEFRWQQQIRLPGTQQSSRFYKESSQNIKGIFQPFELGAETSLIRSAVKFWKAGNFKKKNLMIETHERSLKALTDHLGGGSRVDSFDPQW